MSDITFQMNAEVCVASPVAVNPSIRAKGRLHMFADVMQRVLTVAANTIGPGAVHPRSDMALVPSGGRRLNTLSFGFPHHPFVRVVATKIN